MEIAYKIFAGLVVGTTLLGIEYLSYLGGFVHGHMAGIVGFTLSATAVGTTIWCVFE